MATRASEQASALTPKRKTLSEMTPDELADELRTSSVPASVTAEYERRGIKPPSYGETTAKARAAEAKKVGSTEEEGRGTLLHTKVGEIGAAYRPREVKKDINAVGGFVAPTAKAAVLEKAKAGPTAQISDQIKRTVAGKDRATLERLRATYSKLGQTELANGIGEYLKTMP